MNFPSPADGGISSVYLDEETQHQNYLLQEEVHRIALQSSGSQFDYAVEQTYYQSEQLEYPPLNHLHQDIIPNEPLINNYPVWEHDQNLDTVVTELAPEEIRWFYRCEGDKRWTEFNGYDSFKVEFEYRQYSQEWHSAYGYDEMHIAAPADHLNVEYFDSGSHQAPAGVVTAGGAAAVMGGELPAPADAASIHPTQPEGSAHNASSTSKHQIQVRGGMYEVDLTTWKCYSIFWPGKL